MRNSIVITLCLLLAPSLAGGAEKDDGRQREKPPALVAVAEITWGMVTPEQEFVGTLHFSRIAEVATETEGIVEKASFDEGQEVHEGQVLAVLGKDILETRIAAVQRSIEQAMIEAEQAAREHERAASLKKEGSISEQGYDEKYYRMKSLDKKTAVLRSELDGLRLESKKKKVLAPFGGVIVKKIAEEGEWLSDGGVVAVLGCHLEMDMAFAVPQDIVQLLQEGHATEARIGGRPFTATLHAIVPQGDIATRTFTARFRGKGWPGLLAGMEGSARLPSGEKKEAFLAPRDGVIKKFGRDAVFVVEDGRSRMIQVAVVGYEGLHAGIQGEGLREGQPVIVKGQERLFGGEPVRIENR